MAEAILLNKTANSKYAQFIVYLDESINKALALSDISTTDHFLACSNDTIFHHLRALRDEIIDIKRIADLFQASLIPTDSE